MVVVVVFVVVVVVVRFLGEDKGREREKKEEEVESLRRGGGGTDDVDDEKNVQCIKLTSVNPPSPSSTGTRGGDRGGMIAMTPSPSYSFFFLPPNKPRIGIVSYRRSIQTLHEK